MNPTKEERKVALPSGRVETLSETMNRARSVLDQGTIPVETLEAGTTPMQLPQVEPDMSAVDGTLTATQQFLSEQQSAAQKASEAEALQTNTVRQLQDQLLGRGTEQLDLEQQANLSGRQKTLNELLGRITSATANLEAFDDDTFLGEEALRQEVGARRGTTANFSAEANQRRLQRAVKRTGDAAQVRAMVASAQLQQNNLVAAREEISRAMDLKYGVIEQALQFESQFLDRAIRQADGAQQNALEARRAVIEQQEQAVFDAKKLIEAAALAGASPDKVAALFAIDDPDEQANQARLLLSGMAAQDRAFELEQRNIERAIAGEQLAKLREKPAFQRNTQVIDQGGRKLLIDSDTGELIRDFGLVESVDKNEFQFAVDTEKINAIDALKSHKGLYKSVGINPLDRRGAALGAFSSEDEDFVASIDQLTKSLTIDNLASAKERGATFGALSDTEIALLADSATKINSWRREHGGAFLGVVGGDQKGKTKFFKAGEQDFVQELDKISNFAKLDTYLKGEQAGYWNTVDPATIGVTVTGDGSIWAENGDGTLTKLR